MSHQDFLRNPGSEHLKFPRPRGFQACADGLKISIVVTGMANEFPSTFGKAFDDMAEELQIQVSRGCNAYCSVCREQARALDGLLKICGEPT